MKPMRKSAYDAPFGCSVEATLSVIGGRWKPVILFKLMGGTMRFNELRRQIAGVRRSEAREERRDVLPKCVDGIAAFHHDQRRVTDGGYAGGDDGIILRP